MHPQHGVVETWMPEKGFGFIDGKDGQRYWAHFMDLVTGSGFAELHPGQAVTFTFTGEMQEGFPHARNVAVDGEPPRTREQLRARANRITFEHTEHDA